MDPTVRALILTTRKSIQELVGAVEGFVEFDNGAAEEGDHVEAAAVGICALGALGHETLLAHTGPLVLRRCIARVLIERHGGNLGGLERGIRHATTLSARAVNSVVHRCGATRARTDR
jgi:hypothetical protein